MGSPVMAIDCDSVPDNLVHCFSIEMTGKDIDALQAAAPLLPPGTSVAVTFLPGENYETRIAACKAVRDLGFEPMPHFSARRIQDEAEFHDFLHAVVAEAKVRRCFVIAGDAAEPEGPYADSMQLIASGAFEAAGIDLIGVAGHPEGHPNMTAGEATAVLRAKTDEIERRGMAALIVTQFTFDAARTLDWLAEVRQAGIDVPVLLGVPGPAGIKTLLRFAARCGVGASASVLSKYGISIGHLLGSAGPDRFVDALRAGIGEQHGHVRLHFYPFGGLDKTARWIADYARKH
ncbi:methylenetetrahydrofolate reductase [Rhizorhabdus dicambivorans]|uniref:Methylenetetrahydrofolate reductase n=3 Tax=Pseudomonadota TaxID=1224 RepID=A0A2A4FQM6_9SPHN|nr:methylenetetrahydrofolate reductase [Rhizorhabdus dicambivorans]ALK02319.1 5,10-methylene-THF reductase [Sphingomonas sp. Ndbn-20]QBR39091.1 Mthfr66 [synthetic construct]ATE65736.1 methylenetetrahydrofolate reductase [Rhizorhabdus dicambivorans]PCE39701.1 methylenetetrahydrofolate reductase [Rhizorhabdus dicambivorans]QBR39089.1 methylenetetrahydrofolate reductase [Rhizorhabdus dicambivorans]